MFKLKWIQGEQRGRLLGGRSSKQSINLAMRGTVQTASKQKMLGGKKCRS